MEREGGREGRGRRPGGEEGAGHGPRLEFGPVAEALRDPVPEHIQMRGWIKGGRNANEGLLEGMD